MEWLPVLKIVPDGRPEHTTAGFEFGETYEFRVGLHGKPWIGTSDNFSPYANIAGLWFRPLPAPPLER
jgi:hypothetical protein